MLVTIEGIDGAGKSTVVEAMEERFPDFRYTREPTDTWTGEAVERSVASEEAVPLRDLFLFTADHVNHLRGTVEPAVESGEVVVCDRYIDSRVAYQAAATVDVLDMDTEGRIDWIAGLHDGWSRFPDLTLLLDLDPEVAIDRMADAGRGDVKFERLKFLREVRENYLSLARNNDRFRIVDADMEEGKVIEECADILDETVL
ncbi:MAG: dTMP kinase [Halobacteria archaeon]